MAGHLARAVAEHALAPARDALRAQASSRVSVDGDSVPLLELVVDLPLEPRAPSRARVAAVEAAAERQRPRLLDARALADAEGTRALAALPSRPDAGPAPDALRTEAEALLAATDDAANELVAAAVRARVAEPSPGGPRWHDVLAALRAPALDGQFASASRFRRIGASLAPLGFSRELGAHVRVVGAHGGLDPRARLAVLAAPHDLRIAAPTVEHGLATELSAVDVTGRALALSLGSVGLPPALARPLDASVARTFGAVLAQLLADRGFVRRVLGLTGRALEDVTRAAALLTLLALRVDAAVVLVRGQPSADRAEAAAVWLSRALGGARIPVSLATLVALTPGAGAARFRGRRGGLALHVALREHADEDWFRNPRTSALLRALAARGGALGVEAALAELGGAPSAALERCRELVGR